MPGRSTGVSMTPQDTTKELGVSVSITQTIIEALKTAGIADTDALLQQAGIAPPMLEDPDNRISFEQQSNLWALALEQAGDTFPLTFARQTRIASFNSIGYIAMNSHTIGDAMAAAEQYQTAAGQGGTLSSQDQGQEVWICYQPVNPEHPSSARRSCAMLASNIHLGRSLIGDDYTPLRVQLTMSEPESAELYRDFFQCPVHFEQDSNCLQFAIELKHKPLPHASVELLKLMQQRAQKIIDAITPPSSVAGQVAALLSSTLVGQEPDKGLIAEQLHMSQRTLQRKLAQENTTYQDILNDIRQGLALDYLQQPELSITDIAYLLGFTEPSAFFRAFKKWQGMTPGQYREQQQG